MPRGDKEVDSWIMYESKCGEVSIQTLKQGTCVVGMMIELMVFSGKGGQGSAAFGLTTTGALGPPTGGNGGQGGSVYLTTSSGLTSLHTLRRQYLGGQGGMGAGEHRHGQRGDDVFLEVPVGTVVTEVSREGDEEKHWETAESLNTPMEERKRKRWERWFATQTGFEVETPYYAAAERLLRRERKWATRTPTFEEIPPVRIDMEAPIEEPVRIAAGGQGGVGNPFFSGLHSWKAPRLASRGVMPYTSTFELELKILADVGLVGFPNVGKSTILRALTGRRAEVAGYSFTTLNPQVGVVRVWDDGTWGGGGLSSIGGDTGVVEETWQERARDVQARENGEYMPLPRAGRVRTSRDLGTDANEIMEYEKIEAYRFTISDNPGLLPQASENVGLGHSFLRSIERSLALAYILDLKRPDPASDLMALRTELNNYKEGLPGIGSVVVLNKGDEVGPEEGKEKLAKIREVVKTLDEGGRMEVVVLSGKFGLGLQKLVKILGEKVEIARSRQQEITAETWD